ncbi:hypothetical protein ACXN5S_02625 [Pseudoroseicyclus sp. H15]
MSVITRLNAAAALCVAVSLGAAAPAMAEGNLAAVPTTLDTLELGGDLSISTSEYTLETGKYYHLTVASDGIEEFAFMAPELWRNSWINQVVINDLEVKPMGLYSIEFDDEGEIDIWFVPIRPGRYDFWVDGYENRGMAGFFMVN